MSRPAKLKEQVSPTGLTLFGPLPETRNYYLVWFGPGAGLKLGVNPFAIEGMYVSITHPTADGVYNARAEARAAANAFAEFDASARAGV